MTEQDATQINDLYLKTANLLMAGKACIDRESFRNVSNDSPAIGDMTFEFDSSDTKQHYRIIFKLSHIGSKGFYVDLYERLGLDEWKKIDTHFMSID